MMKFRKQTFSEWYYGLTDKNIILSNEGIGDTIICANLAKYFNFSVIRVSDCDYKNSFSKSFCEFANVNHYFLFKSEEHLIRSNQCRIINQFDAQNLFSIRHNDDLMHRIFTQNHGIEKSLDFSNDVFICPNGSSFNQYNVRRFMTKEELDLIALELNKKNIKFWLVGIEKDIEKYGFYENSNWINSYNIINKNFEKQPINIIKFLEIIAGCRFAITVATSFETICGMLKVDTITLHRYDRDNNPILGNNNYVNFFSNPRWFRTIRKMCHHELNIFLNKII